MANNQQTQKDTNYASQALVQNCSVLKDLDYIKTEISSPANWLSEETSNLQPISTISQVKLEAGLKQEEVMFSDGMDCEFFQDLHPWSPVLSEAEGALSTTDWTNKKEELGDFDSSYTFPTLSWETNNLLAGQSACPSNASSPNTDNMFFNNTYENKSAEKYFDINELPIIFSDEKTESQLKFTTDNWPETLDSKLSQENSPNPFIIEEDSLGENPKMVSWAETKNTLTNDDIIAEFILNDNGSSKICSKQPLLLPTSHETRNKKSLTLDIRQDPLAGEMDVISTPEVLQCVEQLENETFNKSNLDDHTYTLPNLKDFDRVTTYQLPNTSSETLCDTGPATPKSESHVDSDDEKPIIQRKKRKHSEDSDESYKPYLDKPTSKKYKRKKQCIPIEEVMQALETPKIKRGRPPKRRDSTTSNISSDTGSMLSSADNKYRVLRDKNNEASKRSRMNRKLKELQMEQLVNTLEEKNKKLQIKAEVLEDMTKRLKDALMKAILQK